MVLFGKRAARIEIGYLNKAARKILRHFLAM